MIVELTPLSPFAIGGINAESISSDKISASLTVDFDDAITSKEMSEVAVGLKALKLSRLKYAPYSLPKELRPMGGLIMKALKSTKITSDGKAVKVSSSVTEVENK